jgi:F-type H+-transporting ATPase subunit gamma
MRRAQNQAVNSRPYTEALRKVLLSLLQSAAKINHFLMKDNKSGKVAIVLISAEKGLCGGLNTNLFRYLKNFTSQYPDFDLTFLVIGRKGRDFILKSRFSLAADFPEIKENIIFEDTLPVSRFLINAYLKRQIGKTFVCYSDFVSTLSQKPKIIQILPVRIKDIGRQLGLLADNEMEMETFLGQKKEYLIEPSQKTISRWLLPYFIELEIYHFILEAKAAEHSARMVAMKNATDNATQIVAELNLIYNKARQEQITNQIADIATASLAIKK